MSERGRAEKKRTNKQMRLSELGLLFHFELKHVTVRYEVMKLLVGIELIY